MTEQRIDPAIWRAVATELDRIAGAEWPSPLWPARAIRTAIVDMPECVQRDAIATRAWGKYYDTGSRVEDAVNRYLLRALAGALRIEANWAESRALAATAEQAELPVWGEEVW